MTKRSKWLLLVVPLALVLLFAAGLVVTAALLDGEWLKAKLIAKAKDRIDADLTIDSAEFKPLAGRATLTGVHLKRTRKQPAFDVRFDKADVQVSLVHLLFRVVHVTFLELDAPVIEVAAQRPERPKADTPIGKIAGMILSKVAQRTQQPGAPPAKSLEFEVGRLVIRNGSLKYTKSGGTTPPFVAEISGLDYAATDVSIDRFYRLVYRANLRCRIRMGSEVVLVKRGTDDPATFSATGVDLAYLDRFFDQNNALSMVDGTMDVRYRIGSDLRCNFNVVLQNLKIRANLESDTQGWMLMPVQALDQFIKSRGGTLTFGFTVNPPGQRSGITPDTDALGRLFADGLEQTVARMAKSKTMPASLGQGLKALLSIGDGKDDDDDDDR